MLDRLKSEQDATPATELADLNPAVGPNVSEVVGKDLTSPYSGPSRQTVNTIYTIARGANRIHQIVHPSSADYDDDDNDFTDSDDDEDDDDENSSEDDDDDDEEDDGDIDDMRYGDEPLTDQENTATTMGTVAGTATNNRDPTAARYKLRPEEVNDSRPQIPSNSTGAKRNELQVKPPTTTLNNPTTKIASRPDTISKDSAAMKQNEGPKLSTATLNDKTRKPGGPSSETKLTTSTAGSTQLDSKPMVSLAASASAQPCTSTRGAISDTTLAAAKVEVDPLAQTAAAPYGYKKVTVKKPDGTIAKVKRPLKEGEKPPTPAAKAKPSTKRLTGTVKPDVSKPTQPTESQIPNSNASPVEKQTNTSRTPTAVNTEASAKVTKNGTTGTPASSTPLASARKTHDIDEVPLLPQHSKKQLNDVQITVTEVDQNTAVHSDVPATKDEPFKGTHKLGQITKFLVWIVCLLFPLFFLVLGIAAIALDTKRVPKASDPEIDQTYSLTNKPGEKKDPFSQVITVAASLWPIVFAAIVAQTLKMYAAYRVERGIKLVMLEQLISSHSVGGAIKQPFMLRTFNWTTLLLFFIWCLSPLAGQAILRMSTVVEWSDFNTTNVTYFSAQTFKLTEPDYNPWSNFGASDTYLSRRTDAEIPKAVTLALLQGYHQTQNSTQDIYRNLRIPAVVNTTVVSDPEAEYYLESYTSLLGYPFWIKDQNNSDQTTYFNLTSSYFSFDCSNFTRVDPYGSVLRSHNMVYNNNNLMFAAANNTQNWYTKTAYPDNSAIYSNVSRPYPVANVSYMEPGPTGSLYLSSSISADPDDENADPVTGTITYFSECSYHNVVVNTSFYCQSTELNATCTAWNAIQIVDPSLTMSLGYWFPYILQWVSNGEIGNSEVQNFLLDPAFATRRNFADILLGADLTKITTAQLSERLNLVANTLWSLYLQPMAFVATGQPSWFDGNISTGFSEAEITEPDYKVYMVFLPWAVVLIICSVILLIASVAAIIWETRVVGPDFLGFANTAIKKSVKMPKSMSMLDARDRLQALHECEVLLQDVKPGNTVGKIALGVREDSSTMLVAGRRYR